VNCGCTLVSDGKQNLTAVSAKTAPVVNLNPNFASQLTRNAWLDLDAKIPAQLRSTYLPNIWKASTLNGKSFAFLVSHHQGDIYKFIEARVLVSLRQLMQN